MYKLPRLETWPRTDNCSQLGPNQRVQGCSKAQEDGGLLLVSSQIVGPPSIDLHNLTQLNAWILQTGGL